ncbi:DUF1145 domain-containing protein [Myxococcota bacterium]|nr:DUF1145 domain-containing protein [Myxococcota bacterium]
MQPNVLFGFSKAVIGATWLIATACFFAPLRDVPLGGFGRTLFGVLAVVHLVECVAFLGVLRKSGRPLAEELWQTFLFGIVHVSMVRRQIESGGGQG